MVAPENEGKHLPAAFWQMRQATCRFENDCFCSREDDRKVVGDDIRTAEFGWPVGMPLCRTITNRKGLWEIRSNLSGGRISSPKRWSIRVSAKPHSRGN